ncbi:MAG TPA: hypothetical protein VHQ20_01240 [Patescibacteria group bacterium]|jgi:hypothetical protein|nr:hypothetical protein [Patescibacteria group bacterium]
MTLKNINWHDVLTTKFWFFIDPSRIHPSEQAFLYLGIVLVVIGIIFLIFTRFAKNQFLARVSFRFARTFLTTGIVLAIWYLLRFEQAQVLGSKFVAGLITLFGIIFLYGPIKYLIANYKVDMAEAERQASREKYLNRKR